MMLERRLMMPKLFASRRVDLAALTAVLVHVSWIYLA
jgi:hypothetical protein